MNETNFFKKAISEDLMTNWFSLVSSRSRARMPFKPIIAPKCYATSEDLMNNLFSLLLPENRSRMPFKPIIAPKCYATSEDLRITGYLCFLQKPLQNAFQTNHSSQMLRYKRRFDE
ncbi:hypothetical protein ElyMa_001305100 [Elysia marginata]|uniref:Uncharacterized protein n=1 Tax=Elysia marginata TaxID=1093978 RepID=A0AAV4IKK4_9GAST|nr:hypothetical protein ElyMa_001305100 [Elysia marginata]